jgi:hypothetical protein
MTERRGGGSLRWGESREGVGRGFGMEDRSEVEVLVHEGRKVGLVYGSLFVKVVVLVFWSLTLLIIILLGPFW